MKHKNNGKKTIKRIGLPRARRAGRYACGAEEKKLKTMTKQKNSSAKFLPQSAGKKLKQTHLSLVSKAPPDETAKLPATENAADFNNGEYKTEDRQNSRWNSPRTTGLAAAILLLAMLVTAWLSSADNVRAEGEDSGNTLSQTANLKLVKEYIYAGSRMLVIEDYGLRQTPASTPTLTPTPESYTVTTSYPNRWTVRISLTLTVSRPANTNFIQITVDDGYNMQVYSNRAGGWSFRTEAWKDLRKAEKTTTKRYLIWKFGLAGIGWLIILTILATAVFAQEKAYSSNKTAQTLRSNGWVNPSTLGLEMDIPLTSYPGRGGSVPVSLSYSSKVWRIQYNSEGSTYSNPSCYSINGVKYAENSASGWTSSLGAAYIEYTGETSVYSEEGNVWTGLELCSNPLHDANAYIKRVQIHLPSGESQELERRPRSLPLEKLFTNKF